MHCFVLGLYDRNNSTSPIRHQIQPYPKSRVPPTYEEGVESETNLTDDDDRQQNPQYYYGSLSSTMHEGRRRSNYNQSPAVFEMPRPPSASRKQSRGTTTPGRSTPFSAGRQNNAQNQFQSRRRDLPQDLNDLREQHILPAMDQENNNQDNNDQGFQPNNHLDQENHGGLHHEDNDNRNLARDCIYASLCLPSSVNAKWYQCRCKSL